MGHHAQASKMELQNIYVDLILLLLLKNLKKGKDAVSETVDMILDLGLTNEILKENLMSLSMNADLVREFDSIDS